MPLPQLLVALARPPPPPQPLAALSDADRTRVVARSVSDLGGRCRDAGHDIQVANWPGPKDLHMWSRTDYWRCLLGCAKVSLTWTKDQQTQQDTPAANDSLNSKRERSDSERDGDARSALRVRRVQADTRRKLEEAAKQTIQTDAHSHAHAVRAMTVAVCHEAVAIQRHWCRLVTDGIEAFAIQRN